MENKLINYDLGELIDRLSILQIKIMLLDEDCSSVLDLEEDINQVGKEYDIKLTSNMIRQIVLISQANLHIWMLKDLMAEEKDDNKYNTMLKLAQDFNNCVKNSIKNMLLKKTGEDVIPKLKATFSDPGEWYADIIDSVGMNNEI